LKNCQDEAPYLTLSNKYRGQIEKHQGTLINKRVDKTLEQQTLQNPVYSHDKPVEINTCPNSKPKKKQEKGLKKAFLGTMMVAKPKPLPFLF